MRQLIGCLMRDTINFNYQLFNPAHEVGNIRPDWFLTRKFEIIQLAIAQVMPQDFLSGRCFAAQRSRIGQCCGVFANGRPNLRPLTLPLQGQ